MVHLLQEAGADSGSRDAEGLTAADVAETEDIRQALRP